MQRQVHITIIMRSATPIAAPAIGIVILVAATTCSEKTTVLSRTNEIYETDDDFYQIE